MIKRILQSRINWILEAVFIFIIYTIGLILSVKYRIYIGIVALFFSPLLWVVGYNPYVSWNAIRRRVALVIWVLGNILFMDTSGIMMLKDSHLLWTQGYFFLSNILLQWGEFLNFIQDIVIKYFKWSVIPFSFSEYTFFIASHIPTQCCIGWFTVFGSRFYVELMYYEEHKE